MNPFFLNQPQNEKDLYVQLLKITGSLSNLFSDSTIPFLYYRAMENIFCKSFNATNLSRNDLSADAGKAGIGIGLKTFIQNNGKTIQKIAEFNRESYLLKNLKSLDLIHKVSIMRNERIMATMRICDLSYMMYHLITRDKSCMMLYEEPMDLIFIDAIKITKETNSTIHFTDTIHDYSFNLSKSTLCKRFHTTEDKKILEFPIEILEDPYEFLLSLQNTVSLNEMSQPEDDIEDYIVLPLYSPKTNQVEERSGLNQWNARGRKRNEYEVYVPIPSWIHQSKPNFFTYNTDDYRTEPFNVYLPNNKILRMKIAQQGGKALMSNPNSALGEWLLKDVLALNKDVLVTKEQLDTIGIDSIRLSKMSNGLYHLDFLKSGSFDEFEETYRI